MNGNLIEKIEPQGTTTYQWNGFDKMRKVTLPDNSEISFIYGADGLRRKNITSSGATNYLLDGLSVLAEYDDSGNVSVAYIPGVSMTKEGTTYYYHYDALGSVRFISDSGGSIVQEYSYDAWGNLVSSSGSLNQPYQYVGEQGYYTEPSLNLQLLGQRWYDAGVGRFISRDPIPDNNLYVYVRNNSINKIDPIGLIDVAEVKLECKLGTGSEIHWPFINSCCLALRNYAISTAKAAPQLSDECMKQCLDWEGSKGGAIVCKYANCLATKVFKDAAEKFITKLLEELSSCY